MSHDDIVVSDKSCFVFCLIQVDTTILGLDDERAQEMPFIASMGIYVVSKNVMLDLLREKFPGANDFGSEVIPGATALGLRVKCWKLFIDMEMGFSVSRFSN